MSYKQMDRRLADLEREAAAKQQAWVESLSDAELDALLDERWPGFAVAYDTLSDADRDRLSDGKMPDAEWAEHLARAPQRIST